MSAQTRRRGRHTTRYSPKHRAARLRLRSSTALLTLATVLGLGAYGAASDMGSVAHADGPVRASLLTEIANGRMW